MTDSKPPEFVDRLPEEDKRFYSINFLLARFTPAGDRRRGDALMENRLPSGYYKSHDFTVVRFYKNISTPLSHPVPTDGDE